MSFRATKAEFENRGCAIGIAVFAVSLRLLHFWLIMSAGFAVYFLQSFWRDRAPKSSTGPRP
ncbi:MAG: hypothetical protein ABSB88_03815 [Bryobacteraceae bacterium]|jgi:hypothetical protein